MTNMVVLRNRLTSARAGGPRQFSESRDRLLIEVKDDEDKHNLIDELDRYDMTGDILVNAPVVVAEPREDVVNVLERFRQIEQDDIRIRQAIDEIYNSDGVVETTSSIIRATSQLLDTIRLFPMVNTVDFVRTYADYGPENLRVSPGQMQSLSRDELDQEDATLADLNDRLGMREVWSGERGDEAIVAIFDTAFSEDMFSSDRIVGTFHSDEVNSVYDAQEGHGTMVAGAAAASKDDGVPFNGTAPDSGVILVRITDGDGQIRNDIISKAWDWITDLDVSRPVVANHSYGTPLCNGRPRGQFCTGPEIDVIKMANSTADITSVYAAGNEAMQCGHRPSGITNGITGGNSLGEVITVGALRYDLRDAQRYSSHGRGDCAPVSDPKPNVSCALPNKTYYGTEEGTEIKDMSTGIGGSSGGTSHAAPSVAGMIALAQSKAMKERGEPMQTEEIKQLIRDAAEPPRRTQVNSFGLVGEKGYDARFGHGQLNVNKLLDEV